MEDLTTTSFQPWYQPLNFDANSFDNTVLNNSSDTNSFNLGDSLDKIDLSGVASVAGVIGSFLANRDDKKYKRELLDMEKGRIARDREKQDKFQTGMENAWK
ncbi:MAG: Unknown protein [uncultured Sulfurovum sp.]|uniref:Uncharacterized protein n=1 Tax=uncultured Sulfurovum sp. TaxID=269237 RepID=A0A6S6SKI2_9BACT|nr:MAG: Unknown protein [uncultured Sulfurovum sp.]